MEETIIVDVVVTEKTYVGKVNFPLAVPEGMADYLLIPDDLVKQAPAMGLTNRDIKFLLGALRGKWALQVDLNLPDLAPKLGLTFDDIDTMVRGLIEKGYAQMTERLNLYRYWVVVLHCKGIRFDVR